MIAQTTKKIWNVVGIAILFTGVSLVGPSIADYVQNTLNVSTAVTGFILLLIGAFIFNRDG